MDKRTEARLIANSRAWERRKQAQEGRYAVNPLAQHFAYTPEGGIPAGGESDAVKVVEGVEVPYPPIGEGKPSKMRSVNSAECVLLQFNESRTALVPCVRTVEGETELVRITVHNWSINPIPGETIVKTEVRAGLHVVDNGECKPPEDEEDTEYTIDGGDLDA